MRLRLRGGLSVLFSAGSFAMLAIILLVILPLKLSEFTNAREWLLVCYVIGALFLFCALALMIMFIAAQVIKRLNANNAPFADWWANVAGTVSSNLLFAIPALAVLPIMVNAYVTQPTFAQRNDALFTLFVGGIFFVAGLSALGLSVYAVRREWHTRPRWIGKQQ